MTLLLQRNPFSPKGTTGKLFVNGEPVCFTLEPALGAIHPCIPAGSYAIALLYSNRFQRPMPHLQDVPGRTGILIHWGNYAADSEGCILVGDALSDGMAGWFLAHTRNTFDGLYGQLQDEQTSGISITVFDAPESAPEAT